jgi:hypothetical protein
MLIENGLANASSVSNFIHRSAVVTSGSKDFKGGGKQKRSPLVAR